MEITDSVRLKSNTPPGDTFGAPALLLHVNRRLVEFGRFRMLHGDRPSCVVVVHLANLTLNPLDLDEEVRSFPGTP